MGRLDARDDPRVRRPTGQRPRTPFVEKEEAVKRRLIVVLMLVLLVPHLTLAQDVQIAQEPKPEAAPPAPDVKHADPVVVTATKVDTPQSHLGAAVTVINEDEVRTYNYAGVE